MFDYNSIIDDTALGLLSRQIKEEQFEKKVHAFAVESDNIEGINSEYRHKDHTKRLLKLLERDKIKAVDLIDFNIHGKLRIAKGQDVFVGDHKPVPGGLLLNKLLNDIIERANKGIHPFDVHCEFETIHPFTDGNGRTGRALWLWQMVNQHDYSAGLKFLQKFYYQTLDNKRHG